MILVYRGFLLLSGLLAALSAGPTTAAQQPWQMNLSQGVTQTSQSAYDLHMIALWICAVIGLIVFGLMTVAMFRFRKSKGAVPANWSHNTKAEVILTVVPALILAGMAWPATKVMLHSADTSKSELTIKITGYQWKWRYEYLGTQVNFLSSLKRDSDQIRRLRSGLDPKSVEHYLLDVDHPLVIPADTKVRFLLTSGDVIHSWWVPDLGWKQDAIPGQVNDNWTRVSKPGVYRGQCAELCGKDHGFMPIVVEVKPKLEFEAWLQQQNLAAGSEAAASSEPLATASSAPAATSTTLN